MQDQKMKDQKDERMENAGLKMQEPYVRGRKCRA